MNLNIRYVDLRARCLCLLVLVIFLSPVVNATDIILVNQPRTADDKRYEYPQKLLTHILEITKQNYGSALIQYAPSPMQRNRSLIELEAGENIHVMATALKPEWERRLIPIRVPIRKGILGYRVFLILQQHQPTLSRIISLEELKKIPTGSGRQWSTTKTLIENGFDVREGMNYEGLFTMLMEGRFITFGRGISEIFAEYDVYKSKIPELAIEQDLLLHIPLPTYFFVTPKRPKLAERIEEGLLMMIEDGSFDELFNAEFGDMIKAAKLSTRRMFLINNPNLSPATPLDIEHYWYRP
ncbi:transporter substrate-binding domain-containing protein [Alkalimarinus coralli]|uniref:transporter substrate-binding domain-containing protein n=1 Tax=Alkalimarinus coralli TaxID=2935863 RepID=UPI00202B260A|nr:transporter substrate-binding domain-containing protein [Alkalimarinus coralli]